MSDIIGSILWEPFEWAISTKMQGEDQARTLNTHPSLTYRYLPSGALRVSVVWTAHPAVPGHAATEREVYDAGRYGVELESGNLLPGTYLVELRTGRERATEKILLKR